MTSVMCRVTIYHQQSQLELSSRGTHAAERSSTHVDDVVQVFAVEALNGGVGGVDCEEVVVASHQRLRLALRVLLLSLKRNIKH